MTYDVEHVKVKKRIVQKNPKRKVANVLIYEKGKK